VTVDGETHEVLEGELAVTECYNTGQMDHKALMECSNFSAILDFAQTQEMKDMGQAREFVNKVQRLRKDSGL